MLNLLAAAVAATPSAFHIHHFWSILFTALSALPFVFGLVSHTVTRSYKDSTGTTTSKAEIVTGNSEANFDQAVPIAANTHYVFNLTRSQLKSMEITSDIAITIYTNAASGGSPTDTIPVAAGQVIVWTLATDTLTAGPGLVKCPISADVTAGLYITNAGASAANLKIRAVLAT